MIEVRKRRGRESRRTKISTLAKDIDRARRFLSGSLRTDYVRVISVGDEVFVRDNMSYAVVVVPRRVRGEFKDEYVPALVRFNLRTLSIINVVPIEIQVHDLISKSLSEALEVAKSKNEEIRRKKERKRLEKLLSRFSKEEREFILKMLKEEEGE